METEEDKELRWLAAVEEQASLEEKANANRRAAKKEAREISTAKRRAKNKKASEARRKNR